MPDVGADAEKALENLNQELPELVIGNQFEDVTVPDFQTETESLELNFDAPVIPEIESPELVFDTPVIPEIESPELIFDSPVIPEIESPELVFDTPVIPEIESPELIFDSPAVPEIESPELIFDTPVIPEISLNVPDLTLPEISDLWLKTPDFTLPEINAPKFEIPEIPSPERKNNADVLPDKMTVFIDEKALAVLQNAKFSIMQNIAQPDPTSEVINNHYSYTTINNQNQQNPRKNQPIEITLYSTVEMDGETFGSAVKQVTINENMMNGGGYV